jgi:hypothetical protein
MVPKHLLEGHSYPFPFLQVFGSGQVLIVICPFRYGGIFSVRVNWPTKSWESVPHCGQRVVATVGDPLGFHAERMIVIAHMAAPRPDSCSLA